MNRLCLSIFIAVLTVLGCSGCSRRIPAATVVLVDPSASVTERGRKDEFAAVAALIPKMQRGDLLTIVPITDNAAADIEGRVLRLRAPERREAYDVDLRRFRAEADREFMEFAARLIAHPGRKTDILGAVGVAQQEFDQTAGGYDRRLTILSDFLEDDGTYRFTSDPELADSSQAERLAKSATGFGEPPRGICVYLGSVESTSFRILAPKRQRAVRAFWQDYFIRWGSSTQIRLDGTGGLQDR